MFKASSYIHGNIVSSFTLIDVYSPLTKEIIGTLPQLNAEQINDAFESASIAFDNWKLIDPNTKKKYFLLFAERLKQNQTTLTEIIHKETGKSIKDAEAEVIRSIEYIVETIHAYDSLVDNPESYTYNTHIQIPRDISAVYLRVPYGVVLTISPFNYPMNLMITKIVPAILMGNCVVHKSSSQGSLVGWYIAKIFNELTYEKLLITPGVFNYVTTSGKTAGDVIVTNKHIEAFSFTGSTEIGKQLSQKMPLVPKQLEMGGLNSAIVLKDANLHLAVKEILKGTFIFSGQRCTAIKKAIVHESVYSNFIELIKEEVKKYQEEYAPLINQSACDLVKKFYIDAESKGATLITEFIDWNEIEGYFVPPIIFEGIKESMHLYKEELFGPMLGIIKFSDLSEAAKILNETIYGLQASIFSENLDVASNLVFALDVGRVNINQAPSRSPDIMPFSALKSSGIETQGINNSLYFFSRFKGVVYKNKEENN